MNKKDIIEAIHDKVGFSKRETGAIVDAAFELVKTSLVKGNSVMISGFGKFSVRERRARKGRNPQTGQAITLPAGNAVTFKVSQALKERVNAAHRERDTR